MKHLILLLLTSFFIISCGDAVSEPSDSDGVGSGDHRIFITSSFYTGNLGGLAGADEKCQEAADDAGLTRTYQAILSTEATDSSANARLSISGDIYVVDSSEEKALIIASGSSIWDTDSESLLGQINIDERGDTVSATPWTGTDSEGGVVPSGHCVAWSSSSNSFTGETGSTDHLDDRWLESGEIACDNSHPIFCISQ